jgi:hypothetical protein
METHCNEPSGGAISVDDGGFVSGDSLRVQEKDQPSDFSSKYTLEEIKTHVGTITDE